MAVGKFAPKWDIFELRGDKFVSWLYSFNIRFSLHVLENGHFRTLARILLFLRRVFKSVDTGFYFKVELIMNKKFFVSVLVATGLMSSVANAAPVVVDDFNDGSTSGWTDQAGTASENSGVRTGTNFSLGIMDGIASNSIGVDAVGGGYVALVLNYNNLNDSLFVKIQDNNGNGLFDRVFFYQGNNGQGSGVSSVGDPRFEDLIEEVSSTYFQVTVNGDGTISAFIEATGQTFVKTLTHSYTGTGVGLGFWNGGDADNFYVDGTPAPVSAPGSLGLLGLSLMGLGLLRRKKT